MVDSETFRLLGGGGGFFCACKNFWRMFEYSFHAYAFVVVVFLKWILAHTH